MVIQVVRSPARISWWVVCNTACIATRDTKREAESVGRHLAKRYSLPFKGIQSVKKAINKEVIRSSGLC